MVMTSIIFGMLVGTSIVYPFYKAALGKKPNAKRLILFIVTLNFIAALVFIVPMSINNKNKSEAIGSKRHIISSYINTSDGRTFEIEENSTLYYGDDGKLYQLRENRTWYNPIVTYEAVDSGITGTLVPEMKIKK